MSTRTPDPAEDQQSTLGRVFDLEQPRTTTMPVHPAHKPGYNYVLYRRHQDTFGQDGPRSGASGMIVCMEHSGTHIDALCHQASDMLLCGGIPVNSQTQTPYGFSQHGVETILPIVAPGILLNLAAYHHLAALPPGYAISAAELEACCIANQLVIEPGNVVLIYTGNEQYWNDTEAYLAGPGVAADASRWLAQRGVLAVGADTMAWDVIGLRDPELGCTLPGHVILLVQHGIYIMENLRLSELAQAKAYQFTFVCTPLKFVGATGSPIRPIALVATQKKS